MAKKKTAHRNSATSDTTALEQNTPRDSDRERGGDGRHSTEAGPSTTRERATETDTKDFSAKVFPIVGVGASAGGLESLEELLDNMSADTGMAFVVITHQHPDHVSLLPELLGRETKMPVVQATDRVKLQPDHVYVAPPGVHLASLGGTLHLIQFASEKHPRLPIDHFFRSLAEDQHEQAVCIVLSGTGTDGTIGMKAIKAEGGMAMVQKPQTAKYAGMPSSAIDTGLADYVLSPADMPRQLLAYAEGSYLQGNATAADATVVPAEPMEKIYLLLRNQTGHDFSGYKSSTIRRRIQRRMDVHQIEQANEYVTYLRENPQEADILFKELLISVTSFFRDQEAWEALDSLWLPELLREVPEDYTVRAWVPGCATGEEVYSLAMLLRECMDTIERRLEVQVFGTDLDNAAIEMARMACYADGIAVDVLQERLDRFLIREDGMYRVCPEIREMSIFAHQNVIRDPPFTKLDIICCRNLLIYLNAELQERLLPIFHYALKPGGLLFLGPSETVGGFTDLFETLDKRWKIFRRKETPVTRVFEFPASSLTGSRNKRTQFTGTSGNSSIGPQATGRPTIESLLERFLLSRYCPACIVVNERGDIIHFHGRTGAYLEPAEGHPRMNALDMAREGLQVELSSAIRQASEGEELVRENVRIKTNGDEIHVDVLVYKIPAPEAIRGLLIVAFRPIAPPQGKQKDKHSKSKSGRQNQQQPDRIAELEREVQYFKNSYQATLGELETGNQEFKTINEELQSANEELQSTNEELETSKEELQSLNEELTTVNTELQTKVEELSHANDDMQNLLNSTDLATVFLDRHLCIKRYTKQAKDLIHLRKTDVGRPFGELATNLQYTKLAEDCREVLRTLVSKGQEVQRSDGVWYMLRILPYRTTQNVIDGVVITLLNIHELKTARQSAEMRIYFENLFDTIRHPLIVLDENLRVVSANRRFCRMFQIQAKEIRGVLVYEMSENEWDIPQLRELLEELLPTGSALDDYEVEHEFRKLGRKRFLLSAHRVEQEASLPGMILLAIEDVSSRGD